MIGMVVLVGTNLVVLQVATNPTVVVVPIPEPEQPPAASLIVLAENESAKSWPVSDNYTFNAEGFETWRLSANGTLISTNATSSMMSIFISTKNGPVEVFLTRVDFELSRPRTFQEGNITVPIPSPPGGTTQVLPADSQEFVLRVTAFLCTGEFCDFEANYNLSVYLIP